MQKYSVRVSHPTGIVIDGQSYANGDSVKVSPELFDLVLAEDEKVGRSPRLKRVRGKSNEAG